MTTTVTTAWLAGEARARRFLSDGFRDAAARATAVQQAATRPVNPAVIEALDVRTDAQRRTRDRLATRGTACVVTGQQAGLFGGPLYTLYKAAGAIVVAHAMEQQTGTPCVPVFWLQSEDHDFDEIATCPVVGADHERTVIAVPHGGADGDAEERRRSVGVRRLDASIGAALAELDTAVRPMAHGSETVRRLTEAYCPGETWTDAFAKIVQDLFAEHGLLIVDPTRPGLRQAARPVHAHALDQAEAIAEALATRVADLTAAGFTAPIHVRPRSPLSFFHPDGASGPRYRIEPAAEGWRLVGTDRTVATLHDGAFSTSAMLRPILQDTWLPTVAYLGGPGEIAYFAQLAPLYEAFGRPMPLVMPRPRFVLRDPSCDRILDRWGWSLDRLTEPREALLADLVPDTEGPFESWRAAREGLLDALVASQVEASALSKGLGKSVDKTRQNVTRSVDRLIRRYQRAIARTNATAVQRLDRVTAWYAPGGAPQERALSLPAVVARSGWTRLVPALLDAIVPFDGTLKSMALP